MAHAYENVQIWPLLLILGEQSYFSWKEERRKKKKQMMVVMLLVVFGYSQEQQLTPEADNGYSVIQCDPHSRVVYDSEVIIGDPWDESHFSPHDFFEILYILEVEIQK